MNIHDKGHLRGTRRWMNRQATMMVVLLGLALSALMISLVAFELRGRVYHHRTAGLDNVEWSIAQVEVDHLRFTMTITDARAGAVPLIEVRRQFDVLYSRIMILQQSNVFAEVRAEEDFDALLMDIESFLNDAMPLIDGEDEVLRRALPGLADEARAISPAVRNLTLVSVGAIAAHKEGHRSDVVQTFGHLALVTAVLFVVLLGFLARMLWLEAKARRSSERLRRALNRLEAVIDTALDAIIVTDQNGWVLEFNAAAEEVFGYSQTEAVGQDIADLVLPEDVRDAHRAGMARYLITRERRIIGLGRVRREARRKDGSLFPAELSITTAESGKGPIFIAFFKDMSAQVAAERDLVQARDKAMAGERAKARLLAVMSHEIRTPLNGLLGTMELLADTPLDLSQVDLLHIMERSGRLLLRHVNDVLDISRDDAGLLPIGHHPFDITELLIEIVASQDAIAQAGRNRLVLSVLSEPLPRVMGDPVRLQQILLNLLSNALKFTQEGQVELAVKQIAEGRFEFRVTDTGLGIAPQDLARVFDDFVTLDTSYARPVDGTGLGLGIVRRLVQRLGGEVGVSSVPGEGSEFWVYLPFNPVRGELDDPADEAEPLPADVLHRLAAETLHGSRRVLVAEDNSINRTVLCRMLESDGHLVVEAQDGEAAVAMADDLEFDIILMDISMPHLDGVAATRAIRSGTGLSRDVPVIAVTAHALPDQIQAFHKAGMNDVLTKPVSRESLRSMLSKTPLARPVDEAKDESSAPPILDTKTFQETCRSLDNGTASRLVAEFLGSGEAAVTRIIAGERDPEDATLDVHKLAGAAAIFGAFRLRATLLEIEKGLKLGQNQELCMEMAVLLDIWVATREKVLAHQSALDQVLSDQPVC
ncbi:hybrid sensor histidine kinase/response regulator [Rubellimicrobium roseum]|uniref:histidine kinase n=1 Tax=Rubellimicrobium roseum TaxID=687525 RepID=A0A5C4N6Z0_9RHOB|nr:PAS domain-containing hybrid sensor histidine kinase/response regulator [Rubellimicrobium roseum]TNC61406.1 response regulator [Rubellimicrobium roseum]